MNRTELISRAAPTCRDCDEPVQRVEMSWARTPGGEWIIDQYVMVCGNGHRVPVDPLPPLPPIV